MSISRIRKRYCKQKQASPRYDKTIKETVRKLALKHPAGEVARITGINYHTVYRWLKGQKRTYKDQ
jgi:DNA invertase Pin-like site-specific DNA recombinase